MSQETHRAQQAEFRRLKKERAERLQKEAEQKKRAEFLWTHQKRICVSHDELLSSLGLDTDVDILCITPTEGGWVLNIIEKRFVNAS